MGTGRTGAEDWLDAVANRREYITLLNERGPLAPRDLVDRLDDSRSTVTRVLRSLKHAGLVERTADGYRATVAGALAVKQYEQYVTTMEAIHNTKDMLSSIPREEVPPVEALVGAETVRAEEQLPVRALAAVADRVRRADTVRLYLPSLIDMQLLQACHDAALSDDADVTLCVAPDLLSALKGRYPQLLAEMAASDEFEAATVEGPPYGITLTTSDNTTTVSLIVYKGDSAIHSVAINDSDSAVDWGHKTFTRLVDQGESASSELMTLHDIVDGEHRSDRGSLGVSDRPDDDEAGDGHALPETLKREGLTRLSEEYFDTHTPADPIDAWRSGFTLADIRAGHAVPRTTSDGAMLTTDIVTQLRDGHDSVVLGAPGSGKSTVCMQVACEWYDRDVGPVLYRERGSESQLEATALFEAYLRQTDGHTLVVVEDAVREEASAIFELIQAFAGTPDITFLLDAQSAEWRDPDSSIDPEVDEFRHTGIDCHDVPPLNEHECERFISHYTDLVGSATDLSGSELLARLEKDALPGKAEQAPAGRVLLLQYYLTRQTIVTEGGDVSSSSLEAAVRDTHAHVVESGSDLALDLSVLISLLTVAGLQVRLEYLYALAPADEFEKLDRAIALLEGDLLFERGTDRSTGTPSYRTRHEIWSVRFLETMREQSTPEEARVRFGHAITRLLALADDSDHRRRIERHLGERTPGLHQVAADPDNWATETIGRLLRAGLTYPRLAPLFGTKNTAQYELPVVCSSAARKELFETRAMIHVRRGNYKKARSECTRLLTEARADDDRRSEADALHRIGDIVERQGGYDTAREYTEEALAIRRDLGDRRREAQSLNNLGTIALRQGNHDTATQYFEESLSIKRDLGDRQGEAHTLHNLGIVSRRQGEYQAAEKFLKESLNIARELGATVIEGDNLTALGTVVERQGEYQTGREYLEEALAIHRALGDREAQSNVLINLGDLEIDTGDYDTAREHLRESLSTKREIGDRFGEGTCLLNLGEAARQQGRYDTAKTYFEESLAIARDIGDRVGEALSLHGLGQIYGARGEFDTARERLRTAVNIFENVDEVRNELEVIEELARVAIQTGDRAAAIEWCERGIDRIEQADFDNLGKQRDLFDQLHPMK